MSGSADWKVCIPRGLITDRRISAGALRVFQVLLSYADHELACWPSYETIAADAGCRRRQAVNLVAELVRYGYVTRASRPGIRTTVFTLDPEAYAKGIDLGTRVPRTGQSVARDSATDCPGGGQSIALVCGQSIAHRTNTNGTKPRELEPPIVPQGGQPSLPLLRVVAAADPPPRRKAAKPNRFAQGYSEDFEAFWRVYPLKVAKGAAAKVFEEAVRAGIPVETMINGARRMVAAYAQIRGKGAFCPNYPHPTTWLNQRRWESDYEGIAAAAEPDRARAAAAGSPRRPRTPLDF